MATWKKVIVSGSNANLATVQVDNLTSGQVVIGGGSAILTTTPINGTGNIVATTGATGVVMTGSFSGSFTGNLTGTASFANNSTTASYAVTSSLPLLGLITASVNVSTITFTKGDGSTFSFVVATGSADSAAKVTINNTNTGTWYPSFAAAGTSTQSLYVNSASFSYNAATNTLSTTSSWAISASIASTASLAVTASFALTASSVTTLNQNVTINGGLTVNTGSGTEFQVTELGVKIGNIITDRHTLTGSLNVSGSITSSLFGTASWATNAVTASYVLNAISASFAGTASTTVITNTTTGTTYYPTFVVSGSGALPQLVNSASFFYNATTNTLNTTASVAATASYVLQAVSASFASTASYVLNAISASFATTASFVSTASFASTVGAGAIIAVTPGLVNVATSSLTTNQIPKYINNVLSGSNITDTGTQIQIGAAATSGVNIAAGGITVTGNSTFANNVSINGDLTVAGTASFQNTQNLLIGDRFIGLASGSTSLTDGGLIVISSTTTAGGMSGSAFYLEAISAGTYGRFAIAPNVHVSASTVTADEYMVSAKINQGSNPVDATPPTWGSSTNGMGNMWITTAGDIFIYV